MAVSQVNISSSRFLLYVVSFLTVFTLRYVNGLKNTNFLSVGKGVKGAFNVTLNTDSESCVRQCRTYSVCQFVNYRTKYNLCYMLFYSGDQANFTFTERRVSGYTSWLSPWLSGETTPTTSTTTTSTTTTSTTTSTTTTTTTATTTTTTATDTNPATCDENPDQEFCRKPSPTSIPTTSDPPTTSASARKTCREDTYQEFCPPPEPDLRPRPAVVNRTCKQDPHQRSCFQPIVYCIPPFQLGSIPLLGNMYTAGSKVAYVCFDHRKNQHYSQSMTCGTNRRWSNSDSVCSFKRIYGIWNQHFAFKFPLVNEDQDTAMRKCRSDHSSLIRVTAPRKLKFLKSYKKIIFQGINGDEFWVDAKKKSFLKWYTSDGEYVQRGGDMWTFSATLIVNPFADSKCAILQIHHWTLNPLKCSARKQYICEIVL